MEPNINEKDPSSLDVFNTGWKNQPTVIDLKKDLNDASADHDLHVKKVERWLT